MVGQNHRPPVYAVVFLVLCVTGVAVGAAAPPPAAESAGSSAGEVVLNASTVNHSEQPDCGRCHATLETNRTVRELHNEVTYQPDHEFALDHGDGQWCYDCHAGDNMTRLRLANGTTVPWTAENATRQCGSCHGPVYEDWQNHVHGKWTGSWEDPTTEKQCTDCHDPHDPEFHTIEPEPAPREPPSGPRVAQSVLSGTYYFGVGTGLIAVIALVGYAATTLRRDDT